MSALKEQAMNCAETQRNSELAKGSSAVAVAVAAS